MGNSITRHEDDLNFEIPEAPMDYIADMMGTAFRDRVMACLGGTTLRVPRSKAALTDDHELVSALGREDAEEMVELVGAEMFYIPRGPQKSDRHMVVYEASRAGKTTNQIARDLGISDRQVRRLRAKARELLPAE